MIWFAIFFTFVVSQRIYELLIAKKNEIFMLEHGAIEYGSEHYKYIVSLHVLFLVSFFGEVTALGKYASPIWPIWLTLFIMTQAIRIWSLYSLGPYWNTKILIIPDAEISMKGPYRFMRHPNYVIVTLEIMLIPLLFQAYMTAVLFTALNLWMLSVRIPIEEQALFEKSKNYDTYMSLRKRFSPTFQKDLE
ncbi:isoprenylcysteine carboxyl methyltransferase family protein [Sutcliffiella rhizosphaerae]|uniref:Isoprenylcysteine carboxyl methyltransferase n=1 Tax=Sutcliffiella rhizosphaerae TaxID=2880967 RepID=A0ABM8YUT9_9BACI|nr:isoprenylcysteine carboxylmethyltransferase family protein [Sutcliffiella rhizosphaerae]CAG9623694.1 hypothetical protein BACCIP111883_04526 [Sutcliffiella rhizosphaerae]